MTRLWLLLLASCREPTPELVLLSYNLNFANPDVAATLAAIDQTDADVMLLQEVNSGWEVALREHLAGRYPHAGFHVPPGGYAGYAVMSRIPIAVDEQLTKPPGAFYFGNRVVVDGLQILHVHLRAPIDDACFERGCTDADWVKGTLATPPIRMREIEEHWKRVDPKLPTIVAGDFNEGTEGGVIAFLAKQGLARVATSGPPTWHEARGLLAQDIDHVMIDARVTARDAHVLDAGTSDHRPVVVRVRRR